MPALDDHPLDNPAWEALTGPQSSLAIRHGSAARFDPTISPFVGIAGDDQQSWDDLAELLGPGMPAVMFELGSAPDGWVQSFAGKGLQMVAERVEPIVDADLIALGSADGPEMVDLAARTKPGPFESRTVDFGGYVGVRRDGALVAMAGERLHPPGWTEISAVCTDASARGQGLAGRLVRAVAATIAARGDTAMLHVAASNTNAIRLYEQLGFRVRRDVAFAAYISPS